MSVLINEYKIALKMVEQTLSQELYNQILAEYKKTKWDQTTKLVGNAAFDIDGCKAGFTATIHAPNTRFATRIVLA